MGKILKNRSELIIIPQFLFSTLLFFFKLPFKLSVKISVVGYKFVMIYLIGDLSSLLALTNAIYFSGLKVEDQGLV